MHSPGPLRPQHEAARFQCALVNAGRNRTGPPQVFGFQPTATIMFHRSIGRLSAESRQGLARLLPWLYVLPPARLALRPRAAALLTFAGGILLLLTAERFSL